MTKCIGTLLGLTIATIGVTAMPALGWAKTPSKVFLNGVPSPVYFNDGDSFRVLAGAFSGSKARLAGYNTLESYGPVHSWGAKTYWELYVNAKQGTLNARRGPCWDAQKMRPKPGCTDAWHCESDLKRDTYGRILWWCPDLAYDQIRKGLAHVMSVRGPGKEKLIEAQKLALKEGLGMWARGVPEFILTSTHSFDEPYAKETGTAYNRLVSVADGHSQKWLHRSVYAECEEVCRMEVTEPAAIVAAAEALKKMARASAPALTGEDKSSKEGELGDFVAKYDGEALIKIVQRFAEVGEVVGAEAVHVAAFAKVLAAMRKDGRLGKLRRGSCMIYTSYNRRFGSSAASCLR